MIKKYSKTIGLTIIILTSITILLGTTSKSDITGSINDPIITKSYFDQNIEKKVAEELAKLNNGAGTNNPTSPQAPTNSSLTIVQLQQTQTLYGGSGTEIIVRTGKVLVTSSDENGIADVTIGKDITNGAPVELNHLLIVPREGRGIKPDPKNKQDIFVMVRGEYSILNADGTKASP